MAAENIINVSEADFEYEVLKYSQNVPVIVDFWATWCRPCKILSPALEHIANQAEGAFRLAKVDVDENPNLAVLYNVRSIPTVKAFSNGQVVGEFVGLQPEERIREFIMKIMPPSPASLALEKANALLELERWSEAEEIFRQLLEQSPNQPGSLLGLSKVMLLQSKIDDALDILENFPASKQFNQAQLILPFAYALEDLVNDDLPDESDLDAAFISAIRLARRGKLAQALDGLLDILRQDKNYQGGKARQVVLALLEIMGDENPLARDYRSELASVLF
ncbi:MAG TPA: thioredoxin [Anaerolineaceae bacterium]|nr:thioredoxin [Anaerolineaceae bacterium]